jgi:predicted kinase
MTRHLIIIRGNSGSGKTTVAKALRDEMRNIYGKGTTMIVSQDVIRIDILDVKDTSDNESIELIHNICEYGLTNGKNVILDGILDRWKYGDMLAGLSESWGEGVLCYYYDIPREITLERHDIRPQKDVFTKEAMRDWYNADNKLNLPNERVFDEHITVGEAVARIIADCKEDDAL